MAGSGLCRAVASGECEPGWEAAGLWRTDNGITGSLLPRVGRKNVRWAVLVLLQFWFDDCSARDLDHRADENAAGTAPVGGDAGGLPSEASQAGVADGGCIANLRGPTVSSGTDF